MSAHRIALLCLALASSAGCSLLLNFDEVGGGTVDDAGFPADTGHARADATVAPERDATVLPSRDGSVLPASDAAVLPPTDSGLPKPVDAGPKPSDAAIVPADAAAPQPFDAGPPTCSPSCKTECGYDGCGNKCGTCSGAEVCDGTGACVTCPGGCGATSCCTGHCASDGTCTNGCNATPIATFAIPDAGPPTVFACPGPNDFWHREAACAPGWVPCAASQVAWAFKYHQLTAPVTSNMRFWTADVVGTDVVSPTLCYAETHASMPVTPPDFFMGAVAFNLAKCYLTYSVESQTNHFVRVKGSEAVGTMCCRENPPDSVCGSSSSEPISGYMTGCPAKRTFAQREAGCQSANCHVCKLEEWLERPRDFGPPANDYWLAEPFYMNDLTASGHCWAGWNPIGETCVGGSAKVCTSATTDPLGNGCEVFDCGFPVNPTPIQYLGGCGFNDETAGTLCCCF
ncbi:MAG: hypothetical protein QM765_13040 [Myxococcales bacterium]